jgi:hypothetical protein
MSEYESLFNQSDIVICYKQGIYKFLKGTRKCMTLKYPTYQDVIMFLKSSLKVLYCDDQKSVIECNFK